MGRIIDACSLLKLDSHSHLLLGPELTLGGYQFLIPRFLGGVKVAFYPQELEVTRFRCYDVTKLTSWALAEGVTISGEEWTLA